MQSPEWPSGTQVVILVLLVLTGAAAVLGAFVLGVGWLAEHLVCVP